LNSNSGNPAINNRGTIAFFSGFSGGSGIFTPSSVVAKTGDTISGLTLAATFCPAINDPGTIVFEGVFPAPFPPGGLGIFTPSTVVAKLGDTIGGLTLTAFGSCPVINNRGTIVFVGVLVSSSSAELAIVKATPAGE
jgi:hypothetical protein